MISFDKYYLEYLGVDPERLKAGHRVFPCERRKGYGKAVASHATEWCFSHGFRPIYLVDINNKPSIKLAESLGFGEMSREVIVSSCKEIR